MNQEECVATASAAEVSRASVGTVHRTEPGVDRLSAETTNPAPGAEKRQSSVSPADTTSKTKRGRRPAAAKTDAATRVRFFLLTRECIENGKITLADEMKSEDEALVSSLVQGVPFVRVETWMATAQKQAGVVVIEKRPQ